MKKQIKNTLKVGIGSMAGMYVMDSMSNIPGMPSQAKAVSGLANTGLLLSNVGQLMHTAKSVTKPMKMKKKRNGWM